MTDRTDSSKVAGIGAARRVRALAGQVRPRGLGAILSGHLPALTTGELATVKLATGGLATRPPSRPASPPTAPRLLAGRVRRFVLHNAPHLLMASLFAGALVLGVFLLPGEAERIAMLERDGMEREALHLLEDRFATGDRSSRTLYQLSRFYEQTGNVAKARAMLELLAEARPRDAALQQRLAAFYKNTEDKQAYVQALLRQIDAKYSETACKEVVGILRLNGDYTAEQGALQTCRHKGYRRPEDMVRLAQLMAVDGETGPASALLRSVDDLKRLKTERERLQLFAMLLEADQPREALRRGIRWAKGTRDDQMALTLIEMLGRANKQDTALELARAVGTPGDRVSLAVGEILLDKNQGVAAQSYLRGWLDKARGADSALAIRFVEAALGADDAETAFRGAKKFGFGKLGQPQLVALAEGLASGGKRAELTEVFDNLTPEAVSQSRVLTTSLQPAPSAAEGAGPPGAATTAAAADDSLEAWKRGLWNRLMAENARDAALRRMSAEKPGSTAAKAARIIRHQKKVRSLRYRYRARSTASGVGGKSAIQKPGAPKAARGTTGRAKTGKTPAADKGNAPLPP